MNQTNLLDEIKWHNMWEEKFEELEKKSFEKMNATFEKTVRKSSFISIAIMVNVVQSEEFTNNYYLFQVGKEIPFLVVENIKISDDYMNIGEKVLLQGEMYIVTDIINELDLEDRICNIKIFCQKVL